MVLSRWRRASSLSRRSLVTVSARRLRRMLDNIELCVACYPHRFNYSSTKAVQDCIATASDVAVPLTAELAALLPLTECAAYAPQPATETACHVQCPV